VVETEPKASFLLIQPQVPPQPITVDAPVVTIGRSAECTIPIKDRFLSRKHAEVLQVGGEWVLRDCESANGTLLNGLRVRQDVRLRPGDRIGVGDCELVFGAEIPSPSQVITLDGPASHTIASSILLSDVTGQTDEEDRAPERAKLVNALALEMIADRPMEALFDFILDRVMHLLRPSRAALALLSPGKEGFATVRIRRSDEGDSNDLAISRTLLREVIDEKKVVSFVDGIGDEKLLSAKSIIGQQIRSALCAPLLVDNAVLGVLYVDFQITHGTPTAADLRLLAQVAQFAAVKLETTRLREESIVKAKIEEELRTAYEIQKRLLPAGPPTIEGYEFFGINRPCRTVSGDYFDYAIRPDGRIYTIIGDVSGKGITAALIMSGLATAFGIFTKQDPTPDALTRQLNETLAPKTAPRKFVTAVIGVLDPETGTVEFTNAGHVPPLIVSSKGVEQLDTTDLVVGLFPQAQFRTQTTRLEPGSALVLFTDGITEAESPAGEELGEAPVVEFLRPLAGKGASVIATELETFVCEFVGGSQMADDLTLVVISRDA
jgi:serine phosphatase RsbU (regulator of sigma subunit)/pSer/pThr/pTyr-binding forkhead associated (FHA) protein